MSVVSDLDLHCLHICPRKILICVQIQMIGPVTNLFPGHLPTATVLGNYSLHAVKNTFSLSSADTFNTCLKT